MTTGNKSPYRAPGQSAPKPPRPDPDDDGLDASALAQRRKRNAALDEMARLERIATATRQLRIRAGIAMALALVALAFAAPDVLEPSFHGRRTVRVVAVGTTLLAWSVYALVTGTGDAESIDELPRRLRIGQGVAAAVGAGVGLAIHLAT